MEVLLLSLKSSEIKMSVCVTLCALSCMAKSEAMQPKAGNISFLVASSKNMTRFLIVMEAGQISVLCPVLAYATQRDKLTS